VQATGAQQVRLPFDIGLEVKNTKLNLKGSMFEGTCDHLKPWVNGIRGLLT
jgi:hypothetical protein